MFGRKDDSNSATGMPENVTVFRGGPASIMRVPSLSEQTKTTISEIVASGNYLRQHEKEITENQKVLARIAYARLVAFKEAGFSHEDALKLCIQGG